MSHSTTSLSSDFFGVNAATADVQILRPHVHSAA